MRALLRNIWCSPARKTSSEYLKTRNFSSIFLTFSDKKIQRLPVAFESANSSVRFIIQQFSFTANSMKTIVFVAYWCFPVTKDCFERSFPSKTKRFLPFSKTVKMRRKRLKTTCRLTFTGWSTKEIRCFLTFF